MPRTALVVIDMLYSALDVRKHGYELVVPPDAVAHIDPELGEAALEMMERNLHAELVTVADAQLVR